MIRCAAAGLMGRTAPALRRHVCVRDAAMQGAVRYDSSIGNTSTPDWMREDIDVFGSSRQPPHHLGQWFAELVPTDALLRTSVALCGPRALRWLYGGILSSRALVGTAHDHIPDTHSL